MARARKPAPAAAVALDEPDAPKVSVKAVQWSVAVQAIYEDKHGTRSDVFRFDNVQPDMSQADIEAAIKAHFA